MNKPLHTLREEEILKEIIHRNWQNGDEIGLYSEVKDFISSIIAARDKELREKIMDRGSDYLNWRDQCIAEENLLDAHTYAAKYQALLEILTLLDNEKEL